MPSRKIVQSKTERGVMFKNSFQNHFSLPASKCRKRMTWLLKGLLCVAALSATEAQAQSYSSEAFEKIGFTMPKLDRASDIRVNADKMTADQQTGLTVLDGNVLVTFSDITLTCDRATYDYKSGDIHAEGNIDLYSQAGGSWHGDAIDFNHKTGQGLIGTGLLRLGAVSVLADSIARDEDGVAYSRNATITTCTNEQCAWHWNVTGTARYKTQEFIELRDAVFHLGGVPVLWAPYYYRDLNSHYGWRFMPGFSSKWGAYLLTGYVYPIAGSAEEDALLYGKTAIDLRSKHGVAVGQELTWRTMGGLFGDDAIHQGRISAYVSQANDDQDTEDANWQSPYNDYRYSIGFRDRVDISPRDFISIEGEYVSDSEFRTDFKELSVRDNAQPVGIANYEHRENAWVSSLSMGGPLNSFYGGTRRLPEFRLDTLPKKVFDISDLFYESQTTVGWYSRQAAKNSGALWDEYRYTPGNWAYFESARLDTRHMFRRPFHLIDGVTLTPRVGWRGTYYSDSPDGDALFRSLFEMGLTLQARYWRDFETMRHTVIPYLDITYVPGSQGNADDQPYAFDRIDQEYEWRDRYASDGLTPSHRYSGIRLGVRNLLQRRTKDNALTRYFNADLYSVYVAQTQDRWVRWSHRDQPGRDNLSAPARRVKEPTGFRILGLDTAFSPTRSLDFVSDIQYDPEEGRLAFWDIGVRAHTKSVTYYAGYLRRNHDLYDYYWTDPVKDALVYAGFVHHLCDTFDWSLYVRYNTKYKDLEEIGGFLQYNLDCMSFRLNMEYLPAYTTEDTYKHDSDFKLSLGVWLRAYPKEDDMDWMSWGNLTNMRLLEREND